MIVSDIKIRVKRSFGDESAVQVTDDDIIRWINDGQRQIVATNEGLLETTALSDSVKDQQEYSLPSDSLIIKRIHYKAQGEDSHYRLERLNLEEMDEYINGWDGTAYNTSNPTVSAIYADKLILFPTPVDSVTDGIKIYYNRKPTDVSVDADTPDLPEIYHEALVKYCLTRAYEMDEDWEASNLKASELASDISILRGRADWKQQGVYPTITVLPEDRDW